MKRLANAALGTVAGAVATQIMDAVTWIFYNEDIQAREKAIQDKPATEVLAERTLRGIGIEPTPQQVKKLAPLIHWGFGISNGTLYGLLDGLPTKSRLALGLAVAGWMFAFDEFGLSLLKAAPPSTRYPWQTHLRSFVGHLAFGFMLSVAFQGLARLAEPAEDS